MKKHSFIIAAALIVSLSGCSDDPNSGGSSSNDRNEQYTRSFVREIGVPAEGHDFSMATSAGLKIKTSRRTHVTVTAEIDGREYLFADLSLSPGTTAVPVTVPLNVTQLKVNTFADTYIVDTNSTIDLETATGARSGNWTFVEDDNGYIGCYDTDNPPVIAFNTDEFLAEFFNRYPEGQDNTLYTYLKNADGTVDVSDLYEDKLLFPGETELVSLSYFQMDEQTYATQHYYYIFPLWWRKNAAGNMDYKLKMHVLFKPGAAQQFNEMRFGENASATNPFPMLGHSDTPINDAAAITSDKFTYAEESADKAYPRDGVQSIISQGIKFTPYTWLNYSFALFSGNESPDNTVYSSPAYTAVTRPGKYYDVPLDYLFFAYSGTMNYSISAINPNVSFYLKDVTDDSFKQISFDKDNNTAFILGFNSAPTQPADRATRDYADALFLIVPTNAVEYYFWRRDTVEPFEWTIAAEDLGGSDDWDFNDAVFHVTDIVTNLNNENKNAALAIGYGPQDAATVHRITVTPVAAGGTIPLYITYTGDNVWKMPAMPADGTQMYSDVNNAIKESLASDKARSGTFVLGTEIHKWLGESDYTKMLNTGNRREARFKTETVELAIPADEVTYTHGGSAGNTPMGGFAVLVDLDNHMQIDARNDDECGLYHMPSLQLGNDTYLIGAINPDKGEIAPQMLLMSAQDWEWPSERTAINTAYPNFAAWLQDPVNTAWSKSADQAHITKR